MALVSLRCARGNSTCLRVGETLPTEAGELDGEESEEGYGTGVSTCSVVVIAPPAS